MLANHTRNCLTEGAGHCPVCRPSVSSIPVTVTPIGGTCHEIRRQSTGSFLGLIREASPGEWRHGGISFPSAGAAIDHVLRGR